METSLQHACADDRSSCCLPLQVELDPHSDGSCALSPSQRMAVFMSPSAPVSHQVRPHPQGAPGRKLKTSPSQNKCKTARSPAMCQSELSSETKILVTYTSPIFPSQQKTRLLSMNSTNRWRHCTLTVCVSRFPLNHCN